MNIPYFPNIPNHPLIGKQFKANEDGFIFVCTAVKEANNGTVLLSDTRDHICQYYTTECEEII